MSGKRREIHLDRPLADYSAEKLIAIFGTKEHPRVSMAVMLRAFIRNTLKFPGTTERWRSFRNFWYHPIKPALDKLGYLTKEKSDDDPSRTMSQKLSKYVAEGVTAGEYRYMDLRILDNSRKMARATKWQSDFAPGALTFTLTGKLHPNIILAVEKDSMYPAVAEIAEMLGCSAISGKGQDGFGGMERLMRGIRRSGEYRSLWVVAITDYDPAGYNIAKTFGEHARASARNLNMQCYVWMDRIGLEPGQLTEAEIKQERYSLPIPKGEKLGKIAREWMAETGGVNGEEYGIELDALTRDRLKQIILAEISRRVDVEKLIDRKQFRRAYLAGIVAEGLREETEKRLERVIDRVYKEEGKAIVSTGRKVRDAILDGDLYDVEKMYRTSRKRKERIRAKATSYFWGLK